MQTVAAKASDAVYAPQAESSAFGKLIYGVILGLLGYTVVVKRRPIMDFALNLFDGARAKVGKK